MTLKIGQRWLWNFPGHTMVVEVVDAQRSTGRALQVEGDCTYHLINGSEYFDFLHQSGWAYLEGQDKPV